MGKFSAHWLSLREPIDHASRNRDVESAMVHDMRTRASAEKRHLRLLDLGCGSGSNLRAIAPLLGVDQHWTLVDYDSDLLLHARTQLCDWADEIVHQTNNELVFYYQGMQIDVQFEIHDLNQSIESVLDRDVDLVTAAALFDLVSASWLSRFCRHLRSPFYTVLTFNGQMAWEPAHALDTLVVRAFGQHQAGDKGLGGSALGPRASDDLIDALAKAGWQVGVADSPWRVTQTDSDFYSLLMQGISAAAQETGLVSPSQAQAWLSYHGDSRCCTIGHTDLYATKAG